MIHEGMQSLYQTKSYFVTDLNLYYGSSQPAKEYNYALTWMPRNKLHNHLVLTNVLVRLCSRFYLTVWYLIIHADNQ